MNSRIARHKAFWALAAIAAGLSASPASAACVNSATVFCDNTVVQAYNGGSATNYGGPGFVSPGVGDAVESQSHPFDTDRVNVTVTSGAGTKSLRLQYYTKFNGNDLTARYADIFIGNNLNTPDSFKYGIALGNEVGNGGVAAGFYSLANANSYKTSIDLWTSKTSFIYGGQFKGLDGLWHDSPVEITSQASLLNAWNVSVSEVASGDAAFPFLVDVTLMASTANFDFLFGNGLSIFWGTGDCSNDAIELALNKVPEPVTLGMFGAGLAGIAAVRRRRARKAA